MSKEIPPKRFLKKIQEAKEQHLETLDLSYSSNYEQNDPLVKIPEEVFQLKHIKSLNLSGHKIDDIPEYISYLSNLAELNLAENCLRNLPESLGNLSNVTVLNLKENKLVEIPISICNLFNLRSLDLSDNQRFTKNFTVLWLGSLIRLTIYTFCSLKPNTQPLTPIHIRKFILYSYLNPMTFTNNPVTSEKPS